MTWPAVVLWLLILAGAVRREPVMLYVFYMSLTFGGLSLLPPSIVGNVPADTICAAVLIAKTFGGRQNLNSFLGLALDGRKLGILTVFCVYMVVTSVIYPRLLAGQVQVYLLASGGNLSSLRPTSSNITQPIYMLTSILMAFVFAYRGPDPVFRRHFLNASLFGAAVLLASGVVDLALGAHENLLLPFHNATYALLDNVSTGGQKRVVGFMPEASAFGAACCSQLALLYFNRIFYRGIWRKWVVPGVCLGLAFMILASTSTGGYLGLGILVAIVAARFVLQLIFANDITSAHLRQIVWLAALAVAGAVVLLMLPHSFYANMRLLLDNVLFQKAYSSSFVQRSAWTRAGIAAFLHTHGVGIGVGSIRTSNWLVNFAASTGIVGLLLFGSFVLWMILPSRNYPNPQARRFATGLKLALLPGTFVRILSGTTPDPGTGMMLALGLIYGLMQKPRVAASHKVAQPRGNTPKMSAAAMPPLDLPGGSLQG